MSIKKTRLVLLLASLILCLASFLPAVAVQAEDTFKVNAKAAFAVDAQSGKILYDQDGEKNMGIASITKIIGLYIVLDQVKEGKLSWDDKVSISDYAENLSDTQIYRRFLCIKKIPARLKSYSTLQSSSQPTLQWLPWQKKLLAAKQNSLNE